MTSNSPKDRIVTTVPDRQTLEWHDGDMPYSQEFGDHFYCREDGRLECGHVFLSGNGLPERWRAQDTFAIGELGFGTGLNFCETWRQWKATKDRGRILRFVSFERFPMAALDLDRALARWPQIAVERRALVAAWPDVPQGDIEIDFGDGAHLCVRTGDALTTILRQNDRLDAWYLDGFAPSRNPDMWSPELMRAVFDNTKDGGRFATYAAAGFVRRNLQAAGFRVERQPGFAGKREMLCGTRPLDVVDPVLES